MSKAKVKKTNLIDQTKTYSHKIFLANLGLYGKVYEEGKSLADKTSSKYKTISSKNSELFEDLIARGEKVQNNLIETVKKAKDEQMSSIEVKVKSLRESFAKASKSLIPTKTIASDKAA